MKNENYRNRRNRSNFYSNDAKFFKTKVEPDEASEGP